MNTIPYAHKHINDMKKTEGLIEPTENAQTANTGAASPVKEDLSKDIKVLMDRADLALALGVLCYRKRVAEGIATQEDLDELRELTRFAYPLSSMVVDIPKEAF